MLRVSRKNFTPAEWIARRKEQKRIINEKNNKIYYINNKEKILEQRKTPAGIKTNTLSNWKIRGITFGEMTDNMYYDVIYLPATICMSCEKVFDNTICNDKKCNDHNNSLKETDPLYLCNVRGVICFECNIQDRWKTRLTDDSIYQQYL